MLYLLPKMRAKRIIQVVVVRIVDPVSVELDLAVVEVEVRSVVEGSIGIRIFASVHLCHQNLNMVSIGNRACFYS